MTANAPGAWAPRLVPLLLGAVALLPLALLDASKSLTPLVAVVVALVASGLARASPRTAQPLVTATPLVAAFVVVATMAPTSLAGEGLAGFAGLGIVVAATWSPARSTYRLLGALFLPAISVALAWIVALAFPVGTQDLRVALVLLLVALGFLAWALPRPTFEPRATPS